MEVVGDEDIAESCMGLVYSIGSKKRTRGSRTTRLSLPWVPR